MREDEAAAPRSGTACEHTLEVALRSRRCASPSWSMPAQTRDVIFGSYGWPYGRARARAPRS